MKRRVCGHTRAVPAHVALCAAGARQRGRHRRRGSAAASSLRGVLERQGLTPRPMATLAQDPVVVMTTGKAVDLPPPVKTASAGGFGGEASFSPTAGAPFSSAFAARSVEETDRFVLEALLLDLLPPLLVREVLKLGNLCYYTR